MAAEARVSAVRAAGTRGKEEKGGGRVKPRGILGETATGKSCTRLRRRDWERWMCAWPD